jgi:hypothetical protein
MPGGKRTIPHLIDALNVGGAQELPVLLVKKTPKSLYQILVCVDSTQYHIKQTVTWLMAIWG